MFEKKRKIIKLEHYNQKCQVDRILNNLDCYAKWEDYMYKYDYLFIIKTFIKNLYS